MCKFQYNVYWVHFLRRLANEGMIIWVFSEISEGYIPTFAIVFNLSKLGPFSKTYFSSAFLTSVFFSHFSFCGRRDESTWICFWTEGLSRDGRHSTQFLKSGSGAIFWCRMAFSGTSRQTTFIKVSTIPFTIAAASWTQNTFLEGEGKFLEGKLWQIFSFVGLKSFVGQFCGTLCINYPFFVPKCTSGALCHH